MMKSIVALREVCSKVSVGLATAVTPHLVPFGVKLVRNQNIRPNQFDGSSILFLDSDFAEAQASKKLKRGDVVVVRTGANIGDSCVIPDEFDGSHSFTTLIARPRRDVLLPHYLAQYINSEFGRAEVKRLMAGGGKGNLNARELEQLQILVPPVSAQEWIQYTLSAWDGALEKLRRLIELKRKARSAYDSNLLGRASANLHLVRADTLFTPVAERGRDELDVLSVTQDRGVIPRSLLDRQILMESSDTSHFKVVQKGDFVISLRSFEGGLEYSAHHGIVSPAYTVLRCSEHVMPCYFRHYFKSRDFLQRLSVAVVGIRDGKQISFRDFASIKLPVPPTTVQKSIGQLFDSLDREIEILVHERELLVRQKNGLVDRLLTAASNGRSVHEVRCD